MPGKVKKEVKHEVKKEVKKEVRKDLHKIARASHKIHKKPPKKDRNGQILNPIEMAQTADSAQAVWQMLNTDGAYRKFVENSTDERTRFLVGSPLGGKSSTVNWAACTKLQLSSVAWTAATTESSTRVVVVPCPVAHILWSTAFDSTGVSTAYSSMSVQGSGSFAGQYESVACTGITVVVKKTTIEQNVGGLVTYTCYQNMGSAAANVWALSRSQVLSMDGYQWPPNAVEDLRGSLYSTDWDTDFAYNSPTFGGSTSSGVVVIEVGAPASTPQTYEFFVYSTWAGVPLASIFSSEATSGTAKPTPDCVERSKVLMIQQSKLASNPLYSTKRCVKSDGEANPKTWILDNYNQGKKAYGYFKDAFSGAGGAKGVMGNLWEGAKAAGSVVGNILSLFGEEEIVARMLLSMSPDRRDLLWKYILSHPQPPEIDHLRAVVHHNWWKRHNAKPLAPPEVSLFDEGAPSWIHTEEEDEKAPPSPSSRRGKSVPATVRRF